MNDIPRIYYNSTAGSGRAAKIWKESKSIIENITNDNSIIVVGGDGTLNTLLNKLEQPERYRFILVPAGTSNSLAHSLKGISNIDIWQIEVDGISYRFINEASVGFAAAIAREVEHNHTKHFFNRLYLNELAYIATAFKCWFKDEPYFLSLCNNRRISGNLYPCVNADYSDNWLDIYKLACPRWRLPFELLKLVRAKRDKSTPYNTRTRIQEGEWTFANPLPVEIDGNPLPPAKRIKITRYPAQISINLLVL